MDYFSFMAEDVAAFIRKSEEISAANIDGMGIDSQRRNFADLCAYFARPHPDGITTEDREIAGVPTRIYRPDTAAKARMMYFHGGGFVVGDLETHDSICADLVAATGFEMISVDYRLAPEHRHPAALEDCLAVRNSLLAEDDGRPLILVGDSAGGWLAAMVAAENPQVIKGQVLIYPVLGAPLNSASYQQHAHAPLLPADAIAWYWEQYLGATPPEDEVLAPLCYADLSNQPPTRIIAAGLDPLVDDSTLYTEKLEQDGIDVQCSIAKGLPHGFLRSRHITKEGGEAWQQITQACLDIIK